ncbi:MAG TPA: hypothetical protein VH109_11515 [Steroidobacteraceae bacterium]|jgi:hypothetical protein|nr:hypothetical protein [Steroidobacteraceae bacterium]
MRALWAIALVLVCGCGSRQEVSRVASPDGAFDAVLTEAGGDAAGRLYEVYVVRRGATLGRSTALVSLSGPQRSARAAGANLRWLDPQTLAVEYLSARRATVNASEARLEERSVHVLSHAGVPEAAAADTPPAGKP